MPDLLVCPDDETLELARDLGNQRDGLALRIDRGRLGVGPGSHVDQSDGAGRLRAGRGSGPVRGPHPATPDAGLSQSVVPIVLGVGPCTGAELVRLARPDGVRQCEFDVPADRLRDLVEINRKKPARWFHVEPR